jgi:hypothetical protein
MLAAVLVTYGLLDARLLILYGGSHRNGSDGLSVDAAISSASLFVTAPVSVPATASTVEPLDGGSAVDDDCGEPNEAL